MYAITEPSPQDDILKKIASLWNLVGNTPMVEIVYTFRGDKRSIFAKCENYNLTGSIKDRMALHILQRAYEQKKINPGDTIIEATSGNTGISFAAIGRKLGHAVKIVIPDWLSTERMGIIASLGAGLIKVSHEDGGFVRSIRLCEEMATEDAAIFLPRQFSNDYNVEAHALTTGPEIWNQLVSKDIMPEAFVAGVGTGGTVMGVGRFLKEKNMFISVHPLEPAESPTLSIGRKNGTHRIQGISDEFVPGIVKLSELDPVIQAHDGDSIIIAQKLATQLGLAVGISSGANFIGAVKLQNRFRGNLNVVTVFADSNNKYLSTDLMKDEPVKQNYLAPDIKFLEYKSIGRLNFLQR
jgi:cysteine synthase A